MSNLTDLKLRIRVDSDSFDNPRDVLRGGIPQYWRGNDLRIELGIFTENEVVDVSNFSAVTLTIRALNNDGEAPSASAPILLAGECTTLDNTVTEENWESGTAQHALFTFSAEETALLPGDYWLSIWAETDDDPAKTITLGAGLIRVLENGGGGAIQPPEPVVQYYTAVESDAKFVSVEAIDTNTNLGDSDAKIATQHAVKAYVDSAPTPGTTNQYYRGDKSWQDFGASTRAVPLTGLPAGTDDAIASTDTTLAAFAKLQAQLSAITPGMANPMTASGDMITGGTSGTPINLPLGTAGQVLMVNDGGTAAQWQDSASNYVRVGYLLITAQTSYATFQNIFTSSYGSYVLYFSHLMTATNAAYPCIQFMAGSTVLNGGSAYNAFSSAAYVTTYSSQGGAKSNIYLSGDTIVPTSSSCGISGTAFITGTNSANKARIVGTATGHSTTGGAATFFTFGGGMSDIYTIDGFRLYFSNGNFTAGTIAIFGVRNL
ncbi:MAG: hypothetical protein LBF42_01695 [Puniceicoccales bacterium]|jgi:hypothetical protein|nr:hypothetical protein [Puniceicoccales bacterium]